MRTNQHFRQTSPKPIKEADRAVNATRNADTVDISVLNRAFSLVTFNMQLTNDMLTLELGNELKVLM